MQVIPIYYLYGVRCFQRALSKIPVPVAVYLWVKTNIDLLNNLKQQISNRNNTLGSRGQVYFILGILRTDLWCQGSETKLS